MRIRIWPRVQSITRAITALRSAATSEHDMARREVGTKSKDLRAEAEEDTAAAKDLWTELHEREPMKMRDASDDSVHGNSAPVQITRFHLPKDAREAIYSIVTAAAVITSVVLWSKLHDAEKDIQTQVWLRDDALTKFEQGPFADTKAHVLALELNCKEKRP